MHHGVRLRNEKCGRVIMTRRLVGGFLMIPLSMLQRRRCLESHRTLRQNGSNHRPVSINPHRDL
jgi:hypothetical protein